MAEDVRFASNPARVKNRGDLIALLEAPMRQKKTREWVSALEASGIPGGPINRIDEVFADPQVQARGLRIDLPHDAAGSVPLVASPMRLSATPVEYDLPPPMLGQHTFEVLRARLGLTEGELADLLHLGVI